MTLRAKNLNAAVVPRSRSAKHPFLVLLAVTLIFLAAAGRAEAAGAEVIPTTDPTPAGWKSWFGDLDAKEICWVIFGFAGQGCFMMRFVYQWYVSERKGRVVIPLPFWYFSLMGGIMLFIYATHRRDPVFMVAQGLGITIYLRNLMLIYRPRDRRGAGRKSSEAEAPGQNPSRHATGDVVLPEKGSDPERSVEQPLGTA